MFYNWYGCINGFAGRKSKMVRNVNGEVILQTFLCHREGARDDRYNNYAVRKREHKPTSTCGYLARIQVHLDFNTKCWYIKFFDDVHNHKFVDDKYERMLPTHGKMNEYNKYQMRTMRKLGIPTSQIYGFRQENMQSLVIL
ncbi:unnamed protein product [Vicia faba]|uniref:FAR1 domain-containing protein n=1 Tax=Vicia faba TaxID=3906 RepID=A0AAV1A923_VICFA|nr:unnamed protein product [Vicia faba]